MLEPTVRGEAALDESDPRPGPTVVVAAVGLALLVSVGLLLEVLYRRTAEREAFRKTVVEAPLEVSTLRAADHMRLSQYRWVDPTQGVVAVPIERAMELVAAEAASEGRGGPR